MARVPITKEEATLPYYKYFIRPMAVLPEEKTMLADTPQPVDRGIPFSERDLFLSEAADYCHIGFGENADGTAYAANETYVEGATPEMLDWWFAWHAVGSDLRYKLWDPEDHFYAKADNVAHVCNPDIPMNQKTWGVNHQILEDIGAGKLSTTLHFMSPASFGYTPSLVGTARCSTLVCGGNTPAFMTHKCYPYRNGIMIASYFWCGYMLTPDGNMVRIPDFSKAPVKPIMMAKLLYSHNVKEMTNLGTILVDLYNEQKENL